MEKLIGDVWPEQEAVERWWRDNKKSLKEAVTKPRLELQKTVNEAIAVLEKLRSMLHAAPSYWEKTQNGELLRKIDIRIIEVLMMFGVEL